TTAHDFIIKIEKFDVYDWNYHGKTLSFKILDVLNEEKAWIYIYFTGRCFCFYSDWDLTHETIISLTVDFIKNI
ncbi:hypothetical protein J1782_00930, partial [Rahnella sp. BCC 1045]|uniref:hypothetical protein n=1 Tax=Rahnella sp. BCC 1045 TaxID=2816251 RepID=UPI001C2724AA